MIRILKAAFDVTHRNLTAVAAAAAARAEAGYIPVPVSGGRLGWGLRRGAYTALLLPHTAQYFSGNCFTVTRVID